MISDLLRWEEYNFGMQIEVRWLIFDFLLLAKVIRVLQEKTQIICCVFIHKAESGRIFYAISLKRSHNLFSHHSDSLAYVILTLQHYLMYIFILLLNIGSSIFITFIEGGRLYIYLYLQIEFLKYIFVKQLWHVITSVYINNFMERRSKYFLHILHYLIIF